MLTANEQFVMLAIRRLRDDAYALTIQDEIKANDGPKLSLGVLYTVLGRLDREGLVKYRDADPTAERGNRPKRLYELTGKGATALSQTVQTIERMWRPSGAPQGAR